MSTIALQGIRLAPRVWLTRSDVDTSTLNDAPPDTILLRSLKTTAFGDGSHPTTRLCARAVDLVCRQQRPASLLDVGTGTGVLARIARAHGVARVRGTDVDAGALTSARAHAALDVSDALNPIRFDDALPDAVGAYDVVVANILEGVLLALAQSLAAATAPDGILLLSGFTRPQVPGLSAAYAAHGFVTEQVAHDDAWVVMQLKRREPVV